MPIVIEPEAPPLNIQPDGSIRVGGTRVGLEDVVESHLHGLSAERIVAEYPSLELADVHAVISWYLRRREEVDQYVASQNDSAERLRVMAEKSCGRGSDLKRRLEERREPESGQ